MTRALALVALVAACTGTPATPPSGDTTGETPETTPPETATPEKAPAFSLAWSEYPSWSTFGVADELGLVKGKEGEMGEIEKKYNVDIVLREADYDSCIQMYGSGQVDAAALTNMDSLPPSLSRTTVAILPTSTSFGADALLTPKSITSIDQLKGKKIYGLELSVSQYTFDRNVEIAGGNPDEYDFTNMDPAAAATAMQQKQDGYEAIVVWNPFVLDTLNKRDDVHVLADSTKIPGEIVDMVVMGQDSLDKPGGDRFAKAVAAAFYAVSDKIEDPATRSETLTALGAKFAKLDEATMEKIVQQTVFYKTPDSATELFNSDELKQTMEKVEAFAVKRGIVDKDPKVAFGDKASAPDANFRIDPTFVKAVKAGE